jgi:hypothetical protein
LVNDNILLAAINGLLTVPPRLTEVMQANPNASSFLGVISSARVNNSTQDLIQILESNNTHGFTLFAPTDRALGGVGSNLSRLASNETALDSLLGNHVSDLMVDPSVEFPSEQHSPWLSTSTEPQSTPPS